MPKPVVALVGRPNVGKSTLFNRLAGERLAVVDDVPGTTRDRLVCEAEWTGWVFDIVDTGGIDPTQTGPGRSQQPLSIGSADFIEQIRTQAEIAIRDADAVLFLTDADAGLPRRIMRWRKSCAATRRRWMGSANRRCCWWSINARMKPGAWLPCSSMSLDWVSHIPSRPCMASAPAICWMRWWQLLGSGERRPRMIRSKLPLWASRMWANPACSTGCWARSGRLSARLPALPATPSIPI